MPARCLSLDAIRAELAWVNQEPDPNRCGCRNVLCCEREHHAPGACTSPPTAKLWSFRWEYFCATCREYGWCGSSWGVENQKPELHPGARSGGTVRATLNQDKEVRQRIALSPLARGLTK